MVASIDNVMMLADDLSRTTTFTPATNNELASASDYNGSTTYAYDARGRMSTETKNGVTKSYSWTMANLLAGVDSSASGDTDVSYFYTGDLKRIWRLENGSLKNSYKWDAGFNVSEETDWGTSKTKTYADGLAEVDVTGTPAYSYKTQDHLGSTTGMWDGSINQTGSWEYTPYGAPYNFAGPSDVTHLYTGHDLDRVTANYYAPFRTLNPAAGRWLIRDPLGMANGTNMYGYAGQNPVVRIDPYGLWGVGVNISGSIEGGIVGDGPGGGITGVGAAISASAAAGLFGGGHGDVGLGFLREFGGFAGRPEDGASYPCPSQNPFAIGAYAGGGQGFFITNAAKASELAGCAPQWSLNLGPVWPNFSFQFAKGENGKWIFSVANPFLSVGWGASISSYLTKTWGWP
jgi:RHS repeat-associated protein